MPLVNGLRYSRCVCCLCFRRQKATELAGSDEEDVDELSLIDHKEIMSRITLKQEVIQQLMKLNVFCFVFFQQILSLSRLAKIRSWIAPHIAISALWSLTYKTTPTSLQPPRCRPLFFFFLSLRGAVWCTDVWERCTPLCKVSGNVTAVIQKRRWEELKHASRKDA